MLENLMGIITSRAPAPRDQEDLEAISSVLFSNDDLSGNSNFIKKYEQKLSEYFKVKHAIAVSSGTAAIHCGLAALNINRDDEVIVPVTAAVMSAIPIIALHAKPVFVDCQQQSFGICHDSLLKKITTKTKAILSVPMWGYPSYDKEIDRISKEYNIPIIEDAAQAIGTINNGKFEGTNSLIGCFSTHELKLISTGEGGFILTNHQDIADSCRTYSRLGLNISKGISYGGLMGLNYKLNAITAALGCAQIKKIDQRLLIRKNNATLWRDCLKNCEGLEEFFADDVTSKPSYYGMIFLLKNGVPNFGEILHEHGISTDTFRYKYKLLCEYPVFKRYYNCSDADINIDFPNALSLISRLVVLPTHEYINQDVIKKGADIIKKCLNNVG
jgi:perosamine synthetase